MSKFTSLVFFFFFALIHLNHYIYPFLGNGKWLALAAVHFNGGFLTHDRSWMVSLVHTNNNCDVENCAVTFKLPPEHRTDARKTSSVSERTTSNLNVTWK